MMEYYHISNWRDYPLPFVATLACGLRENSRTKMAFNGMNVPTETILSAAIFDRLSTLCWLNSSDGSKGRNRPKSLVDDLMKKEQEKPAGFDTVDAFLAARANILGGG